METGGLESIIFYVSNLTESRRFYVDFLRLPVLYEDDIVIVAGGASGRIVLHRNDCGHDERGIFPAGIVPGAAAIRFSVADPDRAASDAQAAGIPMLWPVQEAMWGRFFVVGDPDGRPVVLAQMHRPRSRDARG